MRFVGKAAFALVPVLVAGVLATGSVSATSSGGLWPSAGQNLDNTRFNGAESKIGVNNVADLAPRWVFTTGGDVSATPAVDGENVYFPDWAGNLYAVNRRTGVAVWSKKISDYTGLPGDKARATPAIKDGTLIIGNQGPFGGGGAVMAVDTKTGALKWKTQVDSHFAAIITQSAVIFDGKVLVGVASLEEALAAIIPDYQCCTFRGSMAALDLATGQILWKTYTAPEGYSGNAVWGSTPSVDPSRKAVYIATGNNYSVPQPVLDCVTATPTNPACVPGDDLFDSVVALDINSGAVKWATRALPFDAWTVDCIPFIGDGHNCPEPAGPDYDFGQGPGLFSIKDAKGKARALVGAGQKSGTYWALDRDTGQVVWSTQAGPGGTAGGLQWGSAIDTRRIYTSNANSGLTPWTLPDGSSTTAGVISALDKATGRVLWQVTPSAGGGTSGPVTTANGVVYGCSLDPQGHMYALNAATGAELWSFASGGSCLSGAAISNGQIFWGSGYSNFGFGTPNNKVYAFGL